MLEQSFSPRGFMNRIPRSSLLLAAALAVLPSAFAVENAKPAKVLTGQAAFTDAAHESPGTRGHVTAADLPAPAPQESVDNGPPVSPRPANAWPIAPKAFPGWSDPQGVYM